MTKHPNRRTALLLAVLTGGVGGHYFYYGWTKAAVLSLLFSWTGIPSFITLFHIFELITMSEEAFQRKFGGKALKKKKATATPDSNWDGKKAKDNFHLIAGDHGGHIGRSKDSE